MSDQVAAIGNTDAAWIIVMDDTCPVVQKLGWVVRGWDRQGTFRFVGSDTTDSDSPALMQRLEESPWSLLLMDKEGQEWLGPEAIPFILKNLPSGKIAAVTYTIPGTMWVTRQLYHFVSRNRRMFSTSKRPYTTQAS